MSDGSSAVLRFLMALIVVALLGFAALIAIMSFSQTDMLFPTHAVSPAGPLPPEAERLELQTADGEHLFGVHLPPSTQSNKPSTLILGFGGNAWNGQDVAEYLHHAFPDADIVAFHYRGYAPSTGRPSAEALMADAPLIYDLAVARVRPDRVIGVGFSIGSGVAASLPRQRKVDGLILVTPFDSLKSVAGDLFPWIPIGPFFQHEIDAADLLRNNPVPVAILAGERDDIVLPRRTQALRRAVPSLVLDRTIAGAGHNDIYDREEFRKGLDEALEIMAAAKK